VDLLVNADLTLLTAGLGLVVLALLGVLVLLRKRRIRASAPEPQSTPAGHDGDLVEVGETTLAEEQLDDRPALTVVPSLEELPHDSAEVRALRVQVRCLEEALVRAADSPAALASYRAQVRAVVRAVAASFDAETEAHRALDRVGAGLVRLEQPGGLTRPALPAPVGATAPTGTVVPTGAPAPLSAATPGSGTEASRAPEQVDDRARDPLDEAHQDDHAHDEPRPEVDEERVVPVPPPAVEQPRRPRRRLRRSAA
jgi:hypothetical protein